MLRRDPPKRTWRHRDSSVEPKAVPAADKWVDWLASWRAVENPGALLLCDGRLAAVVGIAVGRVLTLEFQDHETCTLCGHRERLHLMEAAELFQNYVTPVETVVET